MLLNICYALNVVRLSWLAVALRYLVARLTPTTERAYANPEQVGYAGWIESPAGVLAFVRPDGSLQWRW